MIITTSFSVEGRKIAEYLGIVSGALIMVMGGGNKGTQRGWQTGVDEATKILRQQAEDLGADAVIAVNFAPFGLNICATGTAVKLE